MPYAFLVKPVLGLLLAAALGAAGWFAWQHFVAAPYRTQGRIEGRALERKALLPIIETQTKQLEADITAFKEIEKSFVLIKANSDRLVALAAEAQKVKIIRQTVEKEKVVYLDAIVPSGETACQRTDDVISKALRQGGS